MKRAWTNVALVAGIVALVAVPLAMHGSSAAFRGTDSAAQTTVQSVDPTYKVWFTPFFAPGSTEVQSGLFALQAGIGGLVLGLCLGRLSARKRP